MYVKVISILCPLFFVVVTLAGEKTSYTRPIDHKIGDLDNVKVLTEVDSMVLNNIFSRIVTLDENSEIIDDLAYWWTVEGLGKKYRFKFKKNIFFHDGSKLKLQDIKYSLNRLKVKTGDTFFAFKDIKKISILNEELIIELMYANPDFLTYLADESSIITKKDEPSYLLNGTGPFKLVNQNRDKIVLAKYEKYFGEKPYIKKLNFIYYGSKKEAIYDYLNGDIDDLFHFNLLEKDRKILDEKCQWYFDLLSTHRFLVLRKSSLFAKKKVRSCLFKIFDDSRLRKKLAEGQPVLDSLVAKGVFGDHLLSSPSVNMCDKLSLKELKNNKLEILSTTPYRNAESLGNLLRKNDISSNIRKFESFKKYYEESKKNGDIYFIRYTPRIPSIIFYSTLFFTPNPILSTGVEKQKDVINLVKSLTTLYDKKQRAIIIAQLFDLLDQEKLIYPLHQFEFMGCYSKSWTGVSFPGGNYFMQDFTKLRMFDE